MQSFFTNVTLIGARFQEFVDMAFPPDDDDDDNEGQRQRVPTYALARHPGIPLRPIEPRQTSRLWHRPDSPAVLAAMPMSAPHPSDDVSLPVDVEPQRIAAALEALTARIQPDVTELATLVKDARDLGSHTRLNSLWQSSVFNEILDQGRSCQSLDEILARFQARKLDLVAQLSWLNRFRYGASIKSLVDKLTAHKTVLQEISNRYARLTRLTPGEGAVDILCYFFRPDRLSPHAKAILQLYAESLNTSAHPQPLRWRSLRWTHRP